MEKNHNLLDNLVKKERTFSQKCSDYITDIVGSWTFILTLISSIILWISLNLILEQNKWDPWPFIILNLCLSCLASIQAPIILMSHKRQSQKDRLRTEYDYEIDKKSEKEIESIKKQLDRIEKKI